MTEHLAASVLNDLQDDLLPRDKRHDAEQHLEQCESCAAQLASLRALLSVARSLPAELSAPAGSWDEVRARIAHQQTRPLRRRWAISPSLAAAAALALVAASSTVTMLVMRRPEPMTASQPVLLPAAWQASEQGYLTTVEGLLQQLHEQRSQLAPATVATVEQALATIDEAIGEARAALARDPANAALTDLLASNYRQKVELLRRATRLSAS